MKTAPRVIEWFRDDFPPEMMPDPAIIVGGTSFLSQFMSIVAGTTGGGRLAIAVPFVDRGIASHIPALQQMPHRDIDLMILVARCEDARNCWAEVGSFPWKSIEIRILPRLHAKMFVFLKPGFGGTCLIGSHNLTRAASEANQEAGVLFVGTHDSEVGNIIRGCYDQIEKLARRGKVFVDSLHWPVERVA